MMLIIIIIIEAVSLHGRSPLLSAPPRPAKPILYYPPRSYSILSCPVLSSAVL